MADLVGRGVGGGGAFEDRDTAFMAIPLVEKYMWQIWWAGCMY